MSIGGIWCIEKSLGCPIQCFRIALVSPKRLHRAKVRAHQKEQQTTMERVSKKRKTYICHMCGKPKKGHTCTHPKVATGKRTKASYSGSRIQLVSHTAPIQTTIRTIKKEEKDAKQPMVMGEAVEANLLRDHDSLEGAGDQPAQPVCVLPDCDAQGGQDEHQDQPHPPLPQHQVQRRQTSLQYSPLPLPTYPQQMSSQLRGGWTWRCLAGNLVVPEKVMWVMCNWLAVAKDQVLGEEDICHMLVHHPLTSLLPCALCALPCTGADGQVPGGDALEKTTAQMKIEKAEKEDAEAEAMVAVAAVALHQPMAGLKLEGETVISLNKYMEAQLVDDLSSYLV